MYNLHHDATKITDENFNSLRQLQQGKMMKLDSPSQLQITMAQ